MDRTNLGRANLDRQNLGRRNFIKAGLASSVVLPHLHAGTSVPKRPYNKSVNLSVVGFGGIILMGMEQDASNRIVAEVVERGVNYFDVAPSYGDGEAEEKLGKALAPYRKDVFLACKCERRDGPGARGQLETSLKRLGTDHVDLYQFHAVASQKDVDEILAPNGAGELFRKARQEGKVRNLGFSAHNAEAALRLMDHFEFDSILFPVNYVTWSQGNFGPQMMAKAKEKGIARLALKAMALTKWKAGEAHTNPKAWYRPIDDPALARQALRFTLSEDVTAAIPPGDEAHFRIALDAAPAFQPLSAPERSQLLASAKGVTPIFEA